MMRAKSCKIRVGQTAAQSPIVWDIADKVLEKNCPAHDVALSIF